MFILVPENNSTINYRPKEISLTLTKNVFKNLYKAKMYVNNKKIRTTVSENKVCYNPRRKLHRGKHDVKIVFIDNNHKKVTLQWSFFINLEKHRKIEYNFYFGNPHSHTSYSTGKGTPRDAFKCALDNNLNFLIVTDHSSRLSKSNKWHNTESQAKVFNKQHTNFLALRGFEVTSNKLGHFNVLGSKNYYRKIRNSKDFACWLNKEHSPIVFINHPHKYIESLDYDKDLDKSINFIEVGNGSLDSKYLRGEKYYYKLLDKGWHIGAVNGQDNHKFDWGKSDNLTVVLSKSLKYEDFMEALRNRRTYSSESRSLCLHFKVNDYWMGSIIKPCKTLDFSIKAEDKKTPIDKIEVISNRNEVIKCKNIDSKSRARLNFSIDYDQNRWYVVKICYKNGNCGLSSPIFT